VRELMDRSAADEEVLEETARALVERRLRRGAGAPDGDDVRERRRLTAFLVRRGFPEGIARRAVERALAGDEDGGADDPPAFR